MPVPKPAATPSPPNGVSTLSLDALREHARQASDREDWAESDRLWKVVRKRRPRDVEAIGYLALAASSCGRLQDSEALWKEAIAIAPKNAGLWGNLGEVYRLMLKGAKAEEAIREALRLAPGKLDVHMALANALWDQRKIGESLAALEKIPDEGMIGSVAANLRGNIHSHIGHCAAARKAFARALELRPGQARYASNHLLSLLYDESLSEAQVFAEHVAFGREFDAGRSLATPNPDPSRPLQIAFLSGDFRLHSVAYFVEPLLEVLDRQRYVVTLYSMVAQPDDMTELIASHAARFVNVAGITPAQFEARCAADGIDLLIELSGHTGGNRLVDLGHRLAPVQVSWLGYPHSTGLPSIDARLSDAVIEPLPESQELSSERIWHIPQGAHVYRMPGKPVPPTALPLVANGYPTFICCNNSAKISPASLRLWARLLREFPTARLLLKNSGFILPERGAEVRAFFEGEGIAAERLEIRPLADSVRAHVEMYGEADIALDTFPYTGTTTTCEALWMGLPVVTITGRSARARHSASLLRQVGLDDWVCADEDACAAQVRRALADPPALARLRAELRERLQHSPLGNSVSFAGRFQATLRRIWTEHCRSLGASAESVARGEAMADADEAKGRAALDLARAQWFDRRGEVESALRSWEAVARSGYLDQAWVEAARHHEARGDRTAVLATWREATAVRSGNAEFWAARAEAARAVGELEEAAEAYARTLELSPDNPGVCMNHAAVLRALNRPVAAENAARRALELRPGFPEAWNNLGCTLRDEARFDEAVEAFCQGLGAKPDDALLHSNLVYLLNFIPGMSTEDLRAQHAVFDANQLGNRPVPERFPQRRAGDRPLRLGLLSTDLREHSVGRFLRAALPALRAAAVEVHLFADVARPDAVSEELRRQAHRCAWVAGYEDRELAELIREQSLDVLLELNGHTAGNRLCLLAERLAPLQGSWLGYPMAPGTRGIDVFVTDRTVCPDSDVAPGILRLEDCCLPFALEPGLPDLGSAPSGPLTFGAFHNFPKLNDGVWKNWIRLLDAFPQSRLLVKCRQLGETAARTAWQERLQGWGASLDRIQLLPYCATTAEHLEAYRQVDIALDPSPYNGVTTTMEALSMGVPVVTMPGDTPASRHAASLLKTYRAGQGICEDVDALIANVRKWTENLEAFRRARPQRRETFRHAIDTHRPRWAEQFKSALETALVSNI